MKNIIADKVKDAVLTKSQKQIADYFIRNPELVGISSTMEIAKLIGVSDASITRFARAIGYSGFPELKADIYSNLAMNATGGINSLSLSERYSINQHTIGTARSSMDYCNVIQYNVERSFTENSEETFNKMVSMLMDANHRYIAGFRGCLGAANQAAWLMRMVFNHVVLVTDEGANGIGTLHDIGAGDCLLMFSLSRYYKNDLALLKLAKSRGAKIGLITDSFISPMTEYADIVLAAATKHMGFFHSTVAITMMTEYLVTKATQLMPDSYHKIARDRDSLTEDLRLK